MPVPARRQPFAKSSSQSSEEVLMLGPPQPPAGMQNIKCAMQVLTELRDNHRLDVIRYRAGLCESLWTLRE
eukprot:3706204-Pleurochrysis_carterae.AAC.1